MAGIATTISAQFKAIDKITAPVKRMSRSMGAFSAKTTASLTRVNMKMLAVQNRVKSLGKSLLKNLGRVGMFAGLTALTMVGTNVVKTFADFEQANVVTASVMGKTVDQTRALQVNAKLLGATTAKTATEVVGLQESFARLGFGQEAIVNMTKGTIAGSIAMQGELSDTAELVGAMVKSFDGFSSMSAPDIIDKLTLSTQKSALNFEKLQTALPIVAGAANAASVPFTKMLASLGKIADAGIDASSASTALRNIYIESAKRGVPYEKLLQQVANSTDKLKTANEIFGKRGAVVAVALSKQIEKVDELDKALQSAGGTAGITAARQLDTLKGATTLLGSAWEGFVLSMEDGTGALGNFLKTTVQTITEVLNLASGTAKARGEMTEQEKRIRVLAEKFIHITKVIKNVVIGYVAFIAVQKVFAAALAINKMIRVVQLFMAISKAQGFATAAQWALNVAMNANPVGLIILGVAALVAGVILLVKNWDKLKASFLDSKFLQVIKGIGLAIFSYIVAPIQLLLIGLSKLPKVGHIFKGALDGIDKVKATLTPEFNNSVEKTEIISPAKVEEKRQQNVAQQFGTLNLNIANRSNQDVDSYMFGSDINLKTTGN